MKVLCATRVRLKRLNLPGCSETAKCDGRDGLPIATELKMSEDPVDLLGNHCIIIIKLTGTERFFSLPALVMSRTSQLRHAAAHPLGFGPRVMVTT